MGLPSAKMSPAMNKGSRAGSKVPKKATAPSHSSKLQPRGYPQQQDIQVEQVPQQQNPPAPLSSQQMPMHPSDNGQQEMFDNQMEDERMRAEENILNTHLEAVKEEAQLIQREGEMITTLERAIMNEEEYDMREYLADAR